MKIYQENPNLVKIVIATLSETIPTQSYVGLRHDIWFLNPHFNSFLYNIC